MSRVRLTANNYCHTPVIGGDAIESLIELAKRSEIELDAWVANGGDLNQPAHPDNGITALHALVRRGATASDTVALERLLARGADPNARNRRGETALHRAALTRNAMAVSLLLRYGARPELVDKSGRTVMALLQERDQKESVFDGPEQRERRQARNVVRQHIVHDTLERTVPKATTVKRPRLRL